MFKHNFSFFATDSSGGVSPVTEVVVVLCDNCSGGNGTCNFNDRWGDSAVTSFYRAACECNPGYEGIYIIFLFR